MCLCIYIHIYIYIYIYYIYNDIFIYIIVSRMFRNITYDHRLHIKSMLLGILIMKQIQTQCQCHERFRRRLTASISVFTCKNILFRLYCELSPNSRSCCRPSFLRIILYEINSLYSVTLYFCEPSFMQYMY